MKQLILLTLWAWLMASSFVVSGEIVPYSPPLATTGLRFALALLVILPVLWLLKARQINLEQNCATKKTVMHKQVFTQLYSELIQKQILQPYLFISASLVVFFIGMFEALETTTALNTSVIYTLLPLVGLLISRLWLKEQISLGKLTGFVMGSLAALTLLFSSKGSGPLVWNSGDLLFFVSALFLALHVVAVQKWGSRVEPLTGAFLIVFLGCVLLLPLVLFSGSLKQVQWGKIDFWLYYLHLTLFTTVLTFVLQQWLVKHAGANKLLAFSYTIPLWVALYNAVVFASSALDTLNTNTWEIITFHSHKLNQVGQILSDQFTMGFYLGVILLLLALSLIIGIKTSLKDGYGQKATTK